MTTGDAMPYKWGKLMLNLGNAIGAITDARGGQTAHIYQAAAEEARQVAGTGRYPLGLQRGTGSGVAGEYDASPRRRQVRSPEFDVAKSGAVAPVNAGLLRITSEMAASRETPGKYTADELGRLLGLNDANLQRYEKVKMRKQIEARQP